MSTLDVRPFLERLGKFQSATVVEIEQLCRQHARLFTWNPRGSAPGIIQLTPPFSQTAPSETAALAQGEQKVKTDLFGGRQKAGIVMGLKPSIIDQAEAYERSTNVRLFVKKGGQVYGTDQSLFKPNATYSDLDAHHDRYFQNGKMSEAGGRTRDIGRWKFITKLVTRDSVAENYLSTIRQRVGWAAAAWYAAALDAGLKLAGVPKWIKSQDSIFGDSHIKKTTDAFTLVLINHLPYNDGIRTREKVAAAMNYRRGAMQRGMKGALANAKRKAGF